MASLQDLAMEVGDRIPEILSDWKELTLQRPGLHLPEDLDLDHLPQLVGALIDAAIHRHGSGDPRVRVVELGLQHGRHRECENYPDHLIFREFHVLREAIWRGLHRRHPQEPQTVSVIGRIDATITSATRASLQGYHRKEWDDEVVDKLVQDSVWPQRPPE